MEYINNDNSVKIGANYESTLRVYIGKNNDYFIKQFISVEDSNKTSYSWIWLIGGLWLLYRKMYTYFILSLIPIVNIFIYINLIINSNKIYYKSVCKKIEKDGLTGKDIANQEIELEKAKKHGGTSYIGIIVFLVITVVITIILYGSVIAMFSSFYDHSDDTYGDLDYSEDINSESEDLDHSKDITDEPEDLVSSVYNTYFTYYSEDETIGEAFDNFFTNIEWIENTDDGLNCVNFFGTTTAFGDEPLGVGVMFLIYNDGSIALTNVYLGSEELDESEVSEFLEIIYSN